MLTDIAAAATAAGVFFAAYQLFLQRAQARNAFEDTLVRQYRELIKPELVTDVRLGRLIEGRSPAEVDRLRRIYLYLDLCNEQVFLRAVGRISRATWRVQWADGIRDNIRCNAVIAADWELIQAATADFHELRAFAQNNYRDPYTWEPFWRRLLVRFGLATIRVPFVSAARSAEPPERESAP
jgi:hypothetical protein